MVVKTEICQYTEYKIYPGGGIRFVAKDGKTHLFISGKATSMFHQRIKPVKLTWTQAWRRKNKKGKIEDQNRRKKAKAAKFQKAIVGMSLDDLKRKKGQKVELRQAAKEAAAKEAKARQAKMAAARKKAEKAPAASKVAAAPKNQKTQNKGGAGAAKNTKARK